VSLAVTSKGGWIVAAQAREGNPYDAHTLQSTIDQLVSMSGREPKHVYADMNYRGHDYRGESQVHVDSRRRGAIAGSVWRWMKRRAAIEPSIGHLKEHKRMESNRLKGTEGDKLNAVLSAAGMNFAKLLTALGALWSLLPVRLVAYLVPRPPDGALVATAE
jgi:IS5 family transposase